MKKMSSRARSYPRSGYFNVSSLKKLLKFDKNVVKEAL